mmetsp:Transcript_13561/g.19691  ORF Transcript_13561/g.19691 Transcript_13561/m.19691 type:complete len:257 (-) Transcript_13561:680-1450(-)
MAFGQLGVLAHSRVAMVCALVRLWQASIAKANPAMTTMRKECSRKDAIPTTAPSTASELGMNGMAVTKMRVEAMVLRREGLKCRRHKPTEDWSVWMANRRTTNGGHVASTNASARGRGVHSRRVMPPATLATNIARSLRIRPPKLARRKHKVCRAILAHVSPSSTAKATGTSGALALQLAAGQACGCDLTRSRRHLLAAVTSVTSVCPLTRKARCATQTRALVARGLGVSTEIVTCRVVRVQRLALSMRSTPNCAT